MTTTKRALLDAGRDLFAEKGIENTSIKEILGRARQANASALHYHFGSKQNLILELVMEGSDIIDRRRSAYIDELTKPGAQPTLRDAIHAHTYPIIETVLDTPSIVGHLDILSQVMVSPDTDLSTIVGPISPPNAQKAMAIMYSHMGQFPKAVHDMRLNMMRMLVAVLLRDVIRASQQGRTDDMKLLHDHYSMCVQSLLTGASETALNS